MKRTNHLQPTLCLNLFLYRFAAVGVEGHARHHSSRGGAAGPVLGSQGGGAECQSHQAVNQFAPQCCHRKIQAHGQHPEYRKRYHTRPRERHLHPLQPLV